MSFQIGHSSANIHYIIVGEAREYSNVIRIGPRINNQGIIGHTLEKGRFGFDRHKIRPLTFPDILTSAIEYPEWLNDKTAIKWIKPFFKSL